MKWIKQGKIFEAKGNFGWMNTHAQIPTVLVLEDRLRVYFATRPQSDLGLTAFIDLDKNDPKKILYIHDKPILELGKYGMFDDHGATPSYIMMVDGKVFLYYLGWYLGTSIPYHNAIGLAVSEDNGLSFRKLFNGPVLDRSAKEPYSTRSMCIYKQGDHFHMFYCVDYDWVFVNDRYDPIYHIKHAISRDGIEWTKTDRICIKESYYKEAITRPSVIFKDDLYHMWYSHRGGDDFRDGKDSYRIGYAWSKNLLDWTRADEKSGIEVSKEGWDSTMVVYSCIVESNGRYLMFYNGNTFGKYGFGYAELEA
jgi:predicted GH43/DUF377 family glycosyl hydrolase